MSLLLDALRRAAASKQGPEDDQYVAPRREDSTLEPDAEPAGEDAAAVGGATVRPEQDAAPGDVDFELSLEPETGGPDEPAGGSADDASSGRSSPDSGQSAPAPSRAASASRPAATTLLNARGGGGPRRGHGVLIGIALFVVIVFALAAGGWLFYLDSRRAVDRDLATYQPTAEPLVELEADGPAQSPSAGAAAGSEGDAAADTAAVSEDAGTGADTTAAAGAGESAGTAAESEAADAAETESTGEAASTTGTAAKTTADAGAPEPASAQSEPADSAPASASGSTASSAGKTAETGSGASAEPSRQAQPMVQATGPSLLSRALNAGYAALRAGDLVTAEREYRRALARDRDNRDALLGLASVAQRRGEPERAAGYYQRVLEDQPRDPYARAGLASLAGRVEPRRSETELKRLLRDQPDSPSLHFALGNVYAGESRWGEAQQAYFNAYRAEPDNPEYAYNLAVALDHLEQRQAALEHYRAALAGLDGGAGAGFPAEAVRRRIVQLE